jgi:hypothetical protein
VPGRFESSSYPESRTGTKRRLRKTGGTASGEHQEPSAASARRKPREGRFQATVAVAGLIAAAVVVPPTFQGAVAAWRSADADESGEERERKKEEERDSVTDGPPASISSGSPRARNYYVLPEPIEDRRTLFSYYLSSGEYEDWIRERNGAALSSSSSLFTVRAVHETTVIVQDMRLTGLECGPAPDGTLVAPPPPPSIGGGGTVNGHITVAFDLAKSVPAPREVVSGGPDWELGDPFFSGSAVYLEGGEVADAQRFEAYFVSDDESCEFGLEVLVSGHGDEVWIPVDLGGEEQRTSVTGAADSYDRFIEWEDSEYPDLLDAPSLDGLTTPVTVTGPGREAP